MLYVIFSLKLIFDLKFVWKMQYKPIEKYHVKNVILRKDFNLGMNGSFFHLLTHKGNQFEGNSFDLS
jgi:hypothetical protein